MKRFRKRKFKKKRFRKSTRKMRIRRNPRLQPDGQYVEKIYEVVNLFVSSNVQEYVYLIHHSECPPGNIVPNNVYPNVCQQFRQCAALWQSYRVRGVKIRFVPNSIYAGEYDYRFQPTEVASFQGIATTPVSSLASRQRKDYREFKGNTGWKRYYNVLKWNSAFPIRYQYIDQNNFSSPYPTPFDLVTQFKFYASVNQALGEEMSYGRLEVIWYTQFKDRRV